MLGSSENLESLLRFLPNLIVWALCHSSHFSPSPDTHDGPHCPSTAPPHLLPPLFQDNLSYFLLGSLSIPGENSQNYTFTVSSLSWALSTAQQSLCQIYMLTPFPMFRDTCSKLLQVLPTSLVYSGAPRFQQFFHTTQRKQKLLSSPSSSSRHLFTSVLTSFALPCKHKCPCSFPKLTSPSVHWILFPSMSWRSHPWYSGLFLQYLTLSLLVPCPPHTNFIFLILKKWILCDRLVLLIRFKLVIKMTTLSFWPIFKEVLSWTCSPSHPQPYFSISFFWPMEKHWEYIGGQRRPFHLP